MFVKFYILCIVGPHQPFGCHIPFTTYLSNKVYLTLLQLETENGQSSQLLLQAQNSQPLSQVASSQSLSQAHTSQVLLQVQSSQSLSQVQTSQSMLPQINQLLRMPQLESHRFCQLPRQLLLHTPSTATSQASQSTPVVNYAGIHPYHPVQTHP